MITIQQRLPPGESYQDGARRLVLSFADRCRSRLLTWLVDGTETGLQLPRGTVLRSGDRLLATSGEVIEVLAAEEAVYRVTAKSGTLDPAFDLLRAAYHLGNRHVPVELAPGLLKLEQDPVLRDLLLRLGLEVQPTIESFEPEAGAYGGGHRHDHDASGGSIGEQLSREAHERPDFSAMNFRR